MKVAFITFIWNCLDVMVDPGESHDLAARKPAIVEAMARTLDGWIQSCKHSAAGGDYGDGHADQR